MKSALAEQLFAEELVVDVRKVFSTQVKEYAQRNRGKLPWGCAQIDGAGKKPKYIDCVEESRRQYWEDQTALDRSTTLDSRWWEPRGGVHLWVRILQTAFYGVAVGSLTCLLVLAFFWQAVKKATAAMIFALLLFLVSNSLRLAFNTFWIVYNDVITSSSYLVITLFRALSYSIDLGLIVLLFNLWMTAAKEMSRTEHLLRWSALRLVSIIVLIAALAFDIAGGLIFALAFDNQTLMVI